MNEVFPIKYGPRQQQPIGSQRKHNQWALFRPSLIRRCSPVKRATNGQVSHSFMKDVWYAFDHYQISANRLGVKGINCVPQLQLIMSWSSSQSYIWEVMAHFTMTSLRQGVLFLLWNFNIAGICFWDAWVFQNMFSCNRKNQHKTTYLTIADNLPLAHSAIILFTDGFVWNSESFDSLINILNWIYAV